MYVSQYCSKAVCVLQTAPDNCLCKLPLAWQHSPMPLSYVPAYASGVPKTRSGKIMRRILRKIASKEEKDIGDTSTLADPSVVDQLLETRGK